MEYCACGMAQATHLRIREFTNTNHSDLVFGREKFLKKKTTFREFVALFFLTLLFLYITHYHSIRAFSKQSFHAGKTSESPARRAARSSIPKGYREGNPYIATAPGIYGHHGNTNLLVWSCFKCCGLGKIPLGSHPRTHTSRNLSSSQKRPYSSEMGS
jgi:hypothetical protein